MPDAKLIMKKKTIMHNFNEFWTAESARRRKLWPARYKSILAKHLSTEKIKQWVFDYQRNGAHPISLNRRHVCKSNPIISSDDNRMFSEERLKEQLERYGADLSSFSMTVTVNETYRNMHKYKEVEEVVQIHLEDAVVRITKSYRSDRERENCFNVYPYQGVCIPLSQEGFYHLDTAMLLMEVVADINLRNEEYLYYRKRLRVDNMHGIAAEDISFKLWDDKKLKEKLEGYKKKKYTEKRMLGEVTRQWKIETKKYITLVTEVNRDQIWSGLYIANRNGKGSHSDCCNELRSEIKKIDNNSMVFMTESGNVVIDCLGNTYTVSEEYCYSGNNYNIQFFSEFPGLTIQFKGVCTKAIVGYIRQAMKFNKSLTDYLKKARAWYRSTKEEDVKDYSVKMTLPKTSAVMGTSCRYVHQLKIPQTVEFINDMAFSGMINLTEITVPQRVAYIGAGAFSNCRKLETIQLPDPLMVIWSETFHDCHHLKYVKMPLNLLTIEEKAFANCYRLKSISFPASLMKIDSNAFSFCPLLENLYFNSYTPENINIANDAFDEHVFNTAIVYVPEGCVEAYKASGGFSKFKHICSIE